MGKTNLSSFRTLLVLIAKIGIISKDGSQHRRIISVSASKTYLFALFEYLRKYLHGISCEIS